MFLCRAPEVMLGLPLTPAIDIWSLGCLAATLYLGRQLYGGFTEYEMVSLQLLSTWVRFTQSASVTLVTTYRWGALWRHRASRWNAWCRSQNSRFLLQMSAVLLLLNSFTAIFSGLPNKRWGNTRFSPFCGLVDKNASSWTWKTHHATANPEA